MTKKINLSKDRITIDEFRTWLQQLIADKKGALPDLNDWKLIKEQLDKVASRPSDSNGPGYSILDDDDEYDCTGFDPEPYDFQFTIDLLSELCQEAEDMYNEVYGRDGLHNQFYDEYIKDK